MSVYSESSSDVLPTQTDSLTGTATTTTSPAAAAAVVVAAVVVDSFGVELPEEMPSPLQHQQQQEQKFVSMEVKLTLLVVLCLQNAVYTMLRRYRCVPIYKREI